VFVFRYSFIVYRYANVHVIFILPKENEKNLSKFDKNISFFVVWGGGVDKEAVFMQKKA